MLLSCCLEETRSEQNVVEKIKICHVKYIYFFRKSCDVRDNNGEYPRKMQLACMPSN